MDTQSHRKLRLRELIDAQCDGVISAFAARIDTAESYVSRMLYPVGKAGGKPIADKMMLRIESAFSLPRAWLDMPLGAALPNTRFLVDEARSRPKAHGANEPEPSHGDAHAIGTSAGNEWPFQRVTPAQYGSLSTAQKYHVEDTIFVLMGVSQENAAKSDPADRRLAKAS